MQCQAQGHCDHLIDFQPPKGDIPSTSRSLFGDNSPVGVSRGISVKELGKDFLHTDSLAWPVLQTGRYQHLAQEDMLGWR